MLRNIKQNINILLLLLVAILFSKIAVAQKYKTGNWENMENIFTNAPDSIKTSVYWYWMQDNISKEGVIEDLKSMQKAGINRAFIGSNIGGAYFPDIPAGKVKLFTDEWWEIIHTALKTAGELGIEIGIFNSPGWSQSGGPWVKPTQAMRFLTTSSEVTVTGPQKSNLILPKPLKDFQDVKIIAYPVSTVDSLIFSKKDVEIGAKSKVILDFDSPSNFTVRSILIYPDNLPINAQADFQVFENNEYRTLRSFDINRYNSALQVGFDPYGVVAISIPTSHAKKYRLVVNNTYAACGIKKIELSPTLTVERYVEKSLGKMWQTPLPHWSAYLWTEKYNHDDSATKIDPSKVLDISKYLLPNGTLTWDVPQGTWKIVRMGMMPTGVTNSPATIDATGLETDKLSKKHIETHFQSFIGKILDRIPAQDRKTFKVVVMDSYETGGQNFTDNFIKTFKKRYRYDPLPYLLTLKGVVVGSQQKSDAFLWDLRRLIADKVAYNYVGGLRDISHKNGFTTWLENYGHWGFPGEFLQYGGQSDEIAGEFWSEGELGDIENRAASSCGHIYGKNIISSESFTCVGQAYSRYPATMKERADKFFTEGINHTLLTLFIHQPYNDKYPGINAPFSNEFNRHNTWFTQVDVFLQYIKRVNYMLQQGTNVADVAYFIGEDTPKMTGITDPILPSGYQFDYINAEVILKYLTVKDGRLTLPHGTQYKILVLPKLETMRPEVLNKISHLVAQGAVVLGPAPNRSPSLQNYPMADKQIKNMVKKLWDDVDGINIKSAKRGNGMILCGMDMKQALDFITCQPDCEIPTESPILYGHRAFENGDIYFISNQSDKQQSATLDFRVKNLQPEIWDATTGNITKLPAFIQKDKSTAVPVKLEPFASAFVIFRSQGKPASTHLEANFPTPNVLIEIKTPWKVSFESRFMTPNPIIMDTLQDLSSFTNDSIKYFSGTAIYNNKFRLNKLPDNKKVYLRFSVVNMMAKISINGQYVGGVWTAPYRLDISNFVKLGDNDIKVEVVNVWTNRLIGDLNLPELHRQTYSNVNPYNAHSHLQSSGITGQVLVENL